MAKTIYARIQLEYDNGIVLPFDEGVKLFKLLAEGEYVKEHYGDKPPTFSEVSKEYRFSVLTEQQYKEMKMAAVLGVEELE